VLRAPPESVYKAFVDADALPKWLPPNGFTAKVHSMDARVGGRFRMLQPLQQRPQPCLRRRIPRAGAA
jgi:uncharacterized protein YndB with AHSA1/START domain